MVCAILEIQVGHNPGIVKGGVLDRRWVIV